MEPEWHVICPLNGGKKGTINPKEDVYKDEGAEATALGR
jgi:hypothetical protein